MRTGQKKLSGQILIVFAGFMLVLAAFLAACSGTEDGGGDMSSSSSSDTSSSSSDTSSSSSDTSSSSSDTSSSGSDTSSSGSDTSSSGSSSAAAALNPPAWIQGTWRWSPVAGTWEEFVFSVDAGTCQNQSTTAENLAIQDGTENSSAAEYSFRVDGGSQDGVKFFFSKDSDTLVIVDRTWSGLDSTNGSMSPRNFEKQ